MQDESSINPTSSVEMIARAQEYVAMGWTPTPIHSVGPDGKTCSCSKGGNCGSAGKHPIIGAWQTDLRGVPIFEEVAAKRKRMNIGLLTGDASGFFVLDIDPDGGGFDSMKRLVAEHGSMPKTRIVQTGSGGFHYFFTLPDFDVTNRNKPLKKDYPGLDIRGNGGQVVAPPSISAKGAYAVKVGADIAPAPEWLLDMLRPKVLQDGDVVGNVVIDDKDVPLVVDSNVPTSMGAIAFDPDAKDAWADFGGDPATATAAEPRAQTMREAKYEASIVNGELARIGGLAAAGWNAPWDTTTFEVACQLIELANANWSSLTIEEARDQFFEHCPPEEPGYEPGLKWDSAAARVGNKARPAPEQRMSDAELVFGEDPTQGGSADRQDAPLAGTTDDHLGLTDLGNARRLVGFAGKRLRWAIDAQAWLTYDGRRWDEQGAKTLLKSLAINTIDHCRVNEAPRWSDIPDEFDAKLQPKSSPRERFLGWIAKSEMSARIEAMTNVAEADESVRVLLGDFDLNPMLFNAANCAVNLETGEAIPHSSEQMFRHVSSTIYDPEAKCPEWEKFLARVQPDPDMRDYLQQLLGYSLTGRMDEHALFLHNGPGATGKTTFIEVVLGAMGEYGQKLERETLLSKNGTSNVGATPDIARMAGARFLAASETAAGRKLDEERIKELVGGDTQTARHLYGKPFDFRPTGKIHMATNHLPGFESGGDGIGRRLRLIPWEQQIPEAERDKTLKDRILATEAPGVLAWLVRGAMQWAASGGLVTPASVVDRSREHIDEADPIWPFIHERLQFGQEFSTEFSGVYGAYESWCSLNGNKPMSGKALSQALRERLGPDSKFLDPRSRRSHFRVKLNLQAVITQHEDFFKESRA